VSRGLPDELDLEQQYTQVY